MLVVVVIVVVVIVVGIILIVTKIVLLNHTDFLFCFCLFCFLFVCFLDVVVDEKVASLSPERSLVNSLSSLKRPRSISQEQTALESSDSSNVSVQILVSVDEDDLELGESCGQSLLRGRVEMPATMDLSESSADEEKSYLETALEEGAVAGGEDSDSGMCQY